MPWSLPQSREPELMDDPALAEAEHLHALSALAWINAVSRTAARLAEGVRGLLSTEPGAAAPCVVLDVACGGGDVTIDVARRLRRDSGSRGGVAIVGIDVSGRAVVRAREAAAARGSDASFEVRDVLADGCPACDVAVSSLFLHHLDDATACRLLRAMAAAARRGIVVSDLVRSRLGLCLAVVGTQLLSSSRVARVDGPLSVRAARTPAEYRRLCDDAGLSTATIRRVWPERVVIRWQRPPQETPQ
ncbi:MAG: methyltransferase domain-containing protein [Planctomycetaceae bacterium]